MLLLLAGGTPPPGTTPTLDSEWPAAMRPESCSFGLQKAGLLFRSPFNGTPQALDFIGERWILSVTVPPRYLRESGAVEAFLFRLSGGIRRVYAWHFGRPFPLGTMKGAPTVRVQAIRGHDSLQLQTTPSATLEIGDMIGVGGQLFMCAEFCQANASGHLVVPTVNRVRATIAVGAAVTWSKPKAQFIMPAGRMLSTYQAGIMNGMPFDLEEWWQP